MPRTLHAPAVQSGRQSRSAAQILAIKNPAIRQGFYNSGAAGAFHRAPVANRNTPNQSFEVSRHEIIG